MVLIRLSGQRKSKMLSVKNYRQRCLSLMSFLKLYIHKNPLLPQQSPQLLLLPQLPQKVVLPV
jgi:hypothetical protein